jgi:hypothetical protein
MKTASFTSGGYFKVFVVKISAQMDALHKKLVLRKTQNKFEQCIFLLRIFSIRKFIKNGFLFIRSLNRPYIALFISV